MRTNDLTIMFILIGITVIFLGVLVMRRGIRVRRHSACTTGAIDKVEHHHDTDGQDSMRVSYHYDVDGRTYHESTGWVTSIVLRGNKIPIAYDPSAPSDSSLIDFGSRLQNAINVIVGVMFIGAGIFVMVAGALVVQVIQ